VQCSTGTSTTFIRERVQFAEEAGDKGPQASTAEITPRKLVIASEREEGSK
jgi:hypothetical protein